MFYILNVDIYLYLCSKNNMYNILDVKYRYVSITSPYPTYEYIYIYIYIYIYAHTHTHTHTRKVKVKVTRSCPTLCHPMGDTVHGVLQARTLE